MDLSNKVHLTNKILYNLTSTNAREAITILQGEMQGYYKNARRVDYGPNVKGLDFAVDGLGEFENITHAEAKNAVGSAIESADGFDANIWKQGKKIGKKSIWQKKFWSNKTRTSEVPNTLKNNGGTKTEKSDDNTLIMMRSIVDMPNRDNVQWFEDGKYQGGTNREFEAIHIYDLDKKVIAVFKKSTGKFVTTCQLDRDEHNELLKTGNFGGGKGWFSGQVKNLPPQQTAVNTFESDVTEITPISPMNENSSPDFTPTSSFESDVMGITPIDKSQFDNP